ncbi:MAG: Maf family nucleotide pyrophosphatase [Bacteroidota bacterium]
MGLSFFDKLNDLDVVLGSQSPRRKKLLEETGLPFRVWAMPVEEHFPAHLKGAEVAGYLSKEKAVPFIPLLSPDAILITADTIVVAGNNILNKAGTKQRASEMLKTLSGKKHQVITGVSITSVSDQKTFYEISNVSFYPLTDEEISVYIETCKPFDKAGAYGIQEWIGSVGVEKIEGSYHNVVGLPVARLYRELKEFYKVNFASGVS